MDQWIDFYKINSLIVISILQVFIFIYSNIIFLAKVMKLPKLGDSISDATIIQYHKRNNNFI